MWQGTAHHSLVDVTPLSAGVPPPALIGWRLKSSCGSSSLNQSAIETCHLRLMDTIALCRPAGVAVTVHPAAYPHSSDGRDSFFIEKKKTYGLS